MNRYVSDPLPVPPADAAYQRADLVFYNVDHSSRSFQDRIFLSNPNADVETLPDAEHGYAGAFHIFGHGGCFGDEGHCQVPNEPRDPFDLRSPHQLTPVTKTVIVTDAIRRHSGETVQVTVVPILGSSDRPSTEDVLYFDSLRLLTYE